MPLTSPDGFTDTPQGRGAAEVVVVGQTASDLVLLVDEMPAEGTRAVGQRRREMLGGKGANQAVAIAQLNVRSALLGVVGEGRIGEEILDRASADGVDITAPARRSAGLAIGCGRGHIRQALLAAAGYAQSSVVLDGAPPGLPRSIAIWSRNAHSAVTATRCT
jgi:pfkB family carbohydrate kinase